VLGSGFGFIHSVPRDSPMRSGRRGKPANRRLRLDLSQTTNSPLSKPKPGTNPSPRGVAQAKNYADKMAVPFWIFHQRSRTVWHRHAQRQGRRLGTYIQRRKNFGSAPSLRPTPGATVFAAVPFEDRGGYFQGRYYQDLAIERVMEAIAADKERILLTLATGTGKTFIIAFSNRLETVS